MPYPVCARTQRNWINDGVIAADGSLIRLHAIRWGGRWATTPESIREFFAKLNAGN